MSISLFEGVPRGLVRAYAGQLASTETTRRKRHGANNPLPRQVEAPRAGYSAACSRENRVTVHAPADRANSAAGRGPAQRGS